EGGISTPFIMHWPAGLQTEAGRIRHEPAHLIDVMPTLLDLAQAAYPQQFHGGQDIPPLEGQSLAPLLKGSRFEPHQYLVWEHQSYQAVRKGPWKVVKKIEDPVWKLFDLEKDRTETQDLAAQHPEVVSDLAAYWEQWAKDKGVLPKKKNDE
ncbi:MAG: sulfatase/phosphatase domain-containing protein, partial [Bacteroidota bacterium]